MIGNLLFFTGRLWSAAGGCGTSSIILWSLRYNSSAGLINPLLLGTLPPPSRAAVDSWYSAIDYDIPRFGKACAWYELDNVEVELLFRVVYLVWAHSFRFELHDPYAVAVGVFNDPYAEGLDVQQYIYEYWSPQARQVYRQLEFHIQNRRSSRQWHRECTRMW